MTGQAKQIHGKDQAGSYVARGHCSELITMGAFFDVAVRDLLNALAAFTLTRPTEVRQAAAAESSAHPQEPVSRDLEKLRESCS
jgi:hypothetical protein